jgi:hypothetical protein
MPDPNIALRRHVARLIADLYEGKMSLDEVMRHVADVDPAQDPELVELLRLVASEPHNTWLFGVSGETHRHNSARIRELVAEFAR